MNKSKSKNFFYYIRIIYIFFSLFVLNAWTNWPGNYKCNGEIIYPKTKNELINIVKNISTQNRKIRVIGNGHSFNDIACSDDFLISLKNLKKIISIDKQKKEVTVEGGISIQEFNLLIYKYGLTLPNIIAIYEPTLVGAICTGSHGTGHTGTLSSFVTGIELITADGKINKLSLVNNKSVFEAATTSLGALGIIYSVTVQCEPIFKLKYETKNIVIDELLLQYKKLNQETSFFQFRWNTKKNIVIAELWNRVPLDTPLSDSVQYNFEALTFEKHNTIDRVLSSEIAIPFESLPEGISLLKDVIQIWKQKGIDIPFIIGRCVKADIHSYLSPSANMDVVFLNISTPVNSIYDQAYQDFENKMYQLNGRPHWGKYHFMNYDKALFLYGKNFLKFLEIKKQLDPNNIFTNSYIQRIFEN